MPFKRRFRTRTRRVTRRKRFVRRRPRLTRGLNRTSAGNMTTHRFKRTCSLTSDVKTYNNNVTLGVGGGLNWNAASDAWDINTGTGTITTFASIAHSFTLNSLPAVTDFTALYDMYKITGIKIKITPFSTQSTLQEGVAGHNNQAFSVIMHSLVDPDDSAAFAATAAGVDGMRQYPTYKTRNFLGNLGKPITKYFVPRIAVGVADNTGAAASRMNSGPRYIDMVYLDVQHYAFKYMLELFIPDGATNCYVWWKAEAKYYLSCRTPR